MSDDISNEIQRVVNNIEDDRSRRRRLKSDIEDLYRGYTSLDDQVESLSEENRHYRKQFEKAVKGIDRQLEKNQHRLDAHERQLDGFRSDLDYLRENGVGGSSRRGFLEKGVMGLVGLLGIGAIGTLIETGLDAREDRRLVENIKEESSEYPVENPDFKYTDAELEAIISEEHRLESYDAELSEVVDLEGEKIYGRYIGSGEEPTYKIASHQAEMEIEKDLWLALNDYSSG